VTWAFACASGRAVDSGSTLSTTLHQAVAWSVLQLARVFLHAAIDNLISGAKKLMSIPLR